MMISNWNKSTLDNSPPPTNFKLLRPQVHNIFSAIIELVQELVICNTHNNLGKDTWKTSQLSRPQGQIIDVKFEKSK